MAIDLTLACGEYDLTEALHTGDVEPKGVDLTTVTYESPERHWRMLRHQEFDVCELSMGSYLASRSDPEAFPFTAITVFPHRRFRHSYMFKRADAGVDDPGDFAGKRVGLRSWQTTAGVWMRGIASEHYGLDLESVTWYVDDTEDVSLDLPETFDVRPIPSDTNLERMLIDGDLDGAMYPAMLDSVLDPDLPVDRVFDDSRAVEQAYFEETGIFPIMHTTVVRDEVLERHPWVAVNVYQAFAKSRDICLEKLADPRWTALAWARQYLEHQQSVLGKNPWPFGLTEGNERALETLIGYAEAQGLIPERHDPETLFVPSTVDDEIETKEYVSAEEN
jgi:4,5-dihydroxyphthalate decarboxylase